MSEKNAAESKAAAQEAAERATQAGIASSNAAEEAKRSAGIATDAAGGSALNAENAHKSALNAQQSANNAAESQSAAAASAASAQRNAEQVAIDAKTAVDAKVAAAGSADAAAGSAIAAGNSASAAEESKQAAGASEVKSAESEKAAKASEQAAAESAQAALESKTAAATSEVNAAASAKKAQDVVDSLPEDYTTAVNEIATLKQQVANITPDDSAIGDKPWSSKNIIDMFCPPLEESGNPVVCYPVAGYPLGVKAMWEPAQEGTGTPYTAGGGPNKLNVAGIVSNRTISGITFTVNADGTIGVNGTSTAICFLNPNIKFNKAYLQKIPAGTYRLDFEQTGLSIFLFGYYEDGSETPIVYAGNVVTYAQDAYVGPQIRVAAGATVNTTVRLMLHTGTSAPSAYAGWENIRPIHGRDSVRVERCGENLLDSVPELPIRIYKNSPSVVVRSVPLPAGQYTMKVRLDVTPGGDAITNALIKYEMADGTEKYFVPKASNETSTTTAFETAIKAITVVNYSNIDGNITGISLVPGAAAGDFERYNGQTNTLTLPETVYGGEVDAVTGDGSNNTKVITLDGNELKFSQSSIYFNLPLHSAPGILAREIICCSHFDSKCFGVNANYEFCFILASDIADLFANVDDLNAYLAAQYAAGTPVQIAYRLAEPVPFTATGAQSIPALAGANTILTDADSATVTGRADPIKRITDLEAAVASIN